MTSWRFLYQHFSHTSPIEITIRNKNRIEPAKPRRAPKISVRPNLAARPICAGPTPKRRPTPTGKRRIAPPPGAKARPSRQARLAAASIWEKKQRASLSKSKQAKRSCGPAPGRGDPGQTKNQALRGQRQTRPRSAEFRHYRACAAAAKPQSPKRAASRAKVGGGERRNTAERTGKCGEQASARRGIKPAAGFSLLSLFLATRFHCFLLKPLCRAWPKPDRLIARAGRSNRRKECHSASVSLKRSAANRRPDRASSDGGGLKAKERKRKGRAKAEDGKGEN